MTLGHQEIFGIQKYQIILTFFLDFNLRYILLLIIHKYNKNKEKFKISEKRLTI